MNVTIKILKDGVKYCGKSAKKGEVLDVPMSVFQFLAARKAAEKTETEVEGKKPAKRPVKKTAKAAEKTDAE